MRYLLDTNIVSEPLAPGANPNVLARLRQYDGVIAIASVVWHELVFGASRLPDSKQRRAIETYLFEVVERTLPILPYDAAAAGWHGEERARLQALGLTPPFADGQIAAIACTNHLTLVTRNPRDFDHFRDLSVENWFGPMA